MARVSRFAESQTEAARPMPTQKGEREFESDVKTVLHELTNEMRTISVLPHPHCSAPARRRYTWTGRARMATASGFSCLATILLEHGHEAQVAIAGIDMAVTCTPICNLRIAAPVAPNELPQVQPAVPMAGYNAHRAALPGTTWAAHSWWSQRAVVWRSSQSTSKSSGPRRRQEARHLSLNRSRSVRP